MIAVVPLVGTWIETFPTLPVRDLSASFPLWERGLKLSTPSIRHGDSSVVPLVGTWIETLI